MAVLVSMTYEVVTPESAEHGDADSRGYEWEDKPHTFRELVALMEEHGEPSSMPLREADAHTWFSSAPDHGSRAYFERAEEKSTAIHYSRKNEARSLKYWRKAAHAAGLAKHA